MKLLEMNVKVKEDFAMRKKKTIIAVCLAMAMNISTIPAWAVTGGISLDAVERASGRKNEEGTFGANQYKVGTDIQAGEYMLFAKDGQGYFAVTSDGNGDDIIKNDNFNYNSIITVSDGQYFELVRCYALPIADVERKELKFDKDGMFKVGEHIPAGEYKINANAGETGYYCIYDSSTQENIVSNNNFEQSQYVSVKDGQYLELVRCKFDSVPQMVYTDANTVKMVQEKLNSIGYDCGAPDGMAGNNTVNAIKKYQGDHGITSDGKITDELLCSLEDGSSVDANKTEKPKDSLERDISIIVNNIKNLAKYATVSISEPVEQDGASAYSVRYNKNTFYLIFNPDNNGKVSVGSIPKEMAKDTGAQEYVDFLAYLVQAIDGLASGGDAYTCVMNSYELGSNTLNNVDYTFLKDTASFIATY